MPSINYYSIAAWIAVNQDATYVLPFPYISKANVVFYVNGVQTADSDIDWVTSSTFKIKNTFPVVTNDDIVARRFTRADQRLADFHNSSTLGEEELNIVTKQLLYLIQEQIDRRNAGLDPTPPPGGTGDPGNDPDLVDDIIAQITSSQTWLNLIELITLNDINAEAIMQNSLSIHEGWSVNRILDDVVAQNTIDLSDFGIELDTIDAQIIDINSTIITNESATATALAGIAVRFDDAEANILTLSNAVATLDSATATQITQIQAELDAAEALILTVETASVTRDNAMTSRVDIMESGFISDFSTVDARIGTIESTYVDAAGASALFTTEITTWYASNNWEGLFSTSSYISGVALSSSENEASISGITSFLIGNNADFNDPNTWVDGTFGVQMANMQTTVDGHTDQISAEIDHRTAMFAYFYPAGNGANPDEEDSAGFIAALESTWRVYADEESATVTRIDNLEVNQQPIFFRVTVPDPTAGEFIGTRFSDGFPAGSLWHNTGTPTRLITYYWHDSNSPPYSLGVGDAYTFPGIVGMWVRAYDDEVQTQGASIDNLELLYSNLGVVGGSISSTITSVVGAQINAIQEDLESWIDVETGMMYSGWQVRINQYNNGVPTIAGIGLGMQNDPSNPNGGSISNFIVMADYFSIIRPPDAEDLEGDLLPGDIFVPFIVNTGNVPGEPDVIINGDMFVRNTLSAHNGVAGRFVFTNLDEYGYPETRDVNFDATGNRLVLASDTNHYNESNSASPFVGGSNPQKFHMWAGTGTMNHNNATFYVDTDGNGFFNGQVLADNVSGDISNIHSVDVSAAVQTASGSGWTDVATSGEFAPVGNRERTPSIVVNVDMFGTGQTAGRARIEGRAKVNGVWGSWQLIAESPIYMPIGTTLTLAGVMSPTTGIVQLKSSISRQESSPGNWEYPSSSYMKGVLQMLA